MVVVGDLGAVVTVASAAVAFTPAVFTAVAFVAAPSVAAASATVVFAEPLTIITLAAGAFAAIGSTTAASTIGSSSLAALETHSPTIRMHTTVIIRMTIIPAATILRAIILTVTGTVGFAATAFARVTLTGVPFAVVAPTTVAFITLPRAALDDWYNELDYQGSAAHGKPDWSY
jgi:hypothetical protein